MPPPIRVGDELGGVSVFHRRGLERHMPSTTARARASRPPRIFLPPSLLTPRTLARQVEDVAVRLQRAVAMARPLPTGAANALDLYELSLDIPRCRKCGCTDRMVCPQGCYWVEDPEGMGDLCSACVRPSKGARHG